MNKNFIFKLYVQLLLFIIYLFFIFFLSRAGFILHSGIINSAIADLSISDIFTAFAGGARYDGRLISVFSLIFMVIYLISSAFKKRKTAILIYSGFIYFFVIALTTLNDSYYGIFDDTFNVLILGVIYDDRKAIMQTAMNGDYNILLTLFVISVLAFVSIYIYNLIYKKADTIRYGNFKLNIVLTLFILYLIPLMMASTFNLVGGSLKYLVKLPKDSFLKKTVPNAFNDLNYVINSYLSLKNESFEKYSGGKSLKDTLVTYFGDKAKAVSDINILMEKEVIYGNENKIKHIFIIVAESLSSYHLSDDFIKLGFGSGLLDLSSDKNGKMMSVFLQNGFGTIETMDMLITGLYGTYVSVSEMTGSIPLFNSASGKIFHDLGYENNFYYFGSSAWRRIGNYVIAEGFDNLYAMENMNAKKTSTWGLYDGEGFDFILNTLRSKDKDKPTFNLILTISNHPPYDLPIDEINAPYDDINRFLDEKYPIDKRYPKSDAHMYSVTWYSMKEIADFVKETYKEFPDSLFIITGDHFDRYYPDPVRDIYTKTSVPLIIFGKDVDKYDFSFTAGSHKDIIPTILEMTASKGFKYSSFGDSLLKYGNMDNSSIDSERFAIGSQSIANGRFIYDGEDMEYFNEAVVEDDDKISAINEWKRKAAGIAISWYIVNKGYIVE